MKMNKTHPLLHGQEFSISQLLALEFAQRGALGLLNNKGKIECSKLQFYLRSWKKKAFYQSIRIITCACCGVSSELSQGRPAGADAAL